MKYQYAIIAFATAFLLQSTVLNIFSIFGYTPNLLLCLVILISFLYEHNYKGITLGVIFGLLSDLCFGQYVGIAAIGYLLVGMGVLFTKEILNRENFGAVIIVTGFSTIVYNLIYWTISRLLGSPYTFVYMIKGQPFWIAFNMLVISIAYFTLIGKVTKHRRDRYYR